jgi:hypothetical protein
MKKVWHSYCFKIRINLQYVRFEVFMVVTMNSAIFWNVTTCDSCKNQRFGGKYSLHDRGDKNQQRRTLAVTSNRSMVCSD